MLRTFSVRLTYIQLFAFSSDPLFARTVTAAGATGVVVDWERRGKRRRQASVDTQINGDTPADLAAVRAATSAQLLCRVNGWASSTAAEIDTAIALGADEVLLPMVRRPEEVDAAAAVVAGRAGLGILVETQDALRVVDELVRRPLSRIYVGLNDLMIDRGGSSLFAPLTDGTLERLFRAARAAAIPFGVAGLTVPEGGWPVPCRLLIAELVHIGVSFTFLRRSFHADLVGRDLWVELPRLRRAIAAARRRSPAQVAADHRELEAAVDLVAAGKAV